KLLNSRSVSRSMFNLAHDDAGIVHGDGRFDAPDFFARLASGRISLMKMLSLNLSAFKLTCQMALIPLSDGGLYLLPGHRSSLLQCHGQVLNNRLVAPNQGENRERGRRRRRGLLGKLEKRCNSFNVIQLDEGIDINDCLLENRWLTAVYEKFNF